MEIRVIRALIDADLDSIVEVEKRIFNDPYARDHIAYEAKTKTGFLGVMAYEGGKLCAYKIGYAQDPKRFYSWLGGVLPEFRNRGIAKELMRKQHEIRRRNAPI